MSRAPEGDISAAMGKGGLLGLGCVFAIMNLHWIFKLYENAYIHVYVVGGPHCLRLHSCNYTCSVWVTYKSHSGIQHT